MNRMRHSSPPIHRTFTFVLGLLALGAGVNAQLSVSPQADLQQLAQAITGTGVTISNPSITCHAEGFGEYSYAGSGMSINEGVLLTTGRINDALGPNNAGNRTFQAGTPGDPLLNLVTGRTTYDACKFEFDIIPTGDSLRFDFTFASEEYNEWVGSQYNDVFGFFISGPGIVGDAGAGIDRNIALVPGTTTPVTINNVNNGANAAYYDDNTGGSETQYDGFTVGLYAEALVQPCQTYHLKLIVADASDRKFDGGVFIEKIQSPTVSLSTYTQNGTPEMIEACNPGWIRFDRGDPRPTPLTLQYYLQGSAINGTDYSPIGNTNPAVAKSITIPANEAYVDRPVNPLFDNINEGTEFIRIILGNPNCPSTPLDTAIFNITDSVFATCTAGGIICEGGSWPFTVTGGANYAWTPATGLSCTNCANPVASPTSTTAYQVTVTDGSCARVFNRTVQVSKLTLSALVTDPLCNGGTNGAINLSVANGIAPYTYAWTGPNGFTASTQDITNLQAGTYTVTVTDAACTRTQSWNVIAPAVLGVALTPAMLPFGQNIACNGGSTGSINTLITGGTPPYTISWNGPGGFSASSANISGLSAGTYTINVTDAQGCTVIANTTLSQSPAISFSAAATANVLCFGNNIGSATSTISGGIPPYSYSWNTVPVQTSPTASGLAPGTYTVTLTDSYNCNVSANVTINGPAAALSTSLTGQTNVRCFGNSTGSASIAVSGGTAPYTVNWNTVPPQSGLSAAGLPAGSWTATVNDANGCQTTRTVDITQPTAALSAGIFSQTNVNCFGGNTGSATVSASGGTGPYTYLWNTVPVQNTATANGLAAGSYTCTVRDVNLCEVTVNVTITGPAAALSATTSTQTNVSCFGNATGSATVSANGGTAPYTYSWNTLPVQSSATATGLTAGNYTCTVTDANGCNTTHNVTITQPAAPLGTSVSAQTNVACFGNSTGSATVTATGGTGPYTYTWNTIPVQNNATASGLAAGSYTCTVTDANGCSATRNVTITQPAAPLSGGVSALVNVGCFGNSTGSATVNASGGTAPYAYSWNTSPVQTTAMASNLAAGSFTCTITDANGCSTVVNVTITQPAVALGTSLDSQTNVGCFGDASGSATISASGGTGPYSYAWNTVPAQTGATATGLVAGSYTCTVTDANGCTAVRNVTITQPAAGLNGNISAQTNVACFGNATGSATISVTGGTGPFSYAWNTAPVQSSATATTLVAGTYTCTVTDANSCSITRSVTITQPAAALSSAISSTSNVGCFNGSNGSATVNVSGGTAPYGYAWNTNPVQTGATATGLAAGNHQVTVTDANGCQSTTTATITQPAAALSASINGQTQVGCHGASTGSASATANGGTAPYTFAWNTSPVQSTASASGLSAGTYSCTVTDANGCTATISTTITQPAAALAISGTVTPATCGGAANGAVSTNISGGTGPYTYAWSGPGGYTSAAEDISGLLSGAYTLTVTDANGCSTGQGFSVTQPGLFSISGTTSAYTGGWEVSCASATDGSIDQMISGGTAPYTLAWSGPGGFSSSNEDISALGAGTYVFTLTDANGCGTSATYLLEAPAANSASATAPTVTGGWNIACNGGATGVIDATVNGGTAPYTHAWSGPGAFTSNSLDLAALVAGTYTLTSTDANGCTGTTSITLNQPALLSAAATGTTAVSCFGGANGQSGMNVTGGTAPYAYAWDTAPVQSSATAIGLPAGTYTCTVTDANGCTTTGTATIAQPNAALTAAITAQTNVGIFGQSTGSATVTAQQGTAPYTYAWSNGQNGATATGLAAGVYNVVITDANGCTTNASATITQPLSALSVSLGAQSNVDCFGNATGSATVNASGGTPGYSYSWNTSPAQNGPTANGLVAGVYTCTVTDANGAIASMDVTITQPAAALAGTPATATHVDCFGNATGSATVNVSGGTAPYALSWNTAPVQSGATASALTAGSYTCTITDANGCPASVAVTITGPAAPLAAAISGQQNVSCTGGANGSATVNATGGTAPYTYDWNTAPVQSTPTATGLAAGPYTCTVIDANGCTTEVSAMIDQPAAAISVSIGSTTQATCGNQNGGALAVANGGTAPYTYAWSSAPVQTNAQLDGVAPGTYTVTATDALGCTATAQATVTAPGALSIALVGTTAQTCFGVANGQATVSATGGSLPYTFSWSTSPAQSSATASGLSAGTYTAMVTDANGCTASMPIAVQGPASPLQLTSSATVNVLCFGASTGSATVNASGGLAPFAITWNTVPVQSGSSATDLAAGTYTATVVDAFGCASSSNVTITQPAAPIDGYVDAQINVGCHGGTNGSATIEATGGSGSYIITWNTIPAQNGPTATGLSAGLYFATVNDANGCTTPKLVPVNITEPAAPLSLTTTISDHLGHAISCNGGSDGLIAANTNGGTPAYSYQWSGPNGLNATSATVQNLSAGTYNVTVTDANGCTATATNTLTAPGAIATSGAITTAACNGSNTGAVNVTTTGGIAPYAFAWSGPNGYNATGEDISSVLAGVYTLTVTDANGCTAVAPFNVNEPGSLTITGTAHTYAGNVNVTCATALDGSVDATTSGGVQPYSWQWTGPNGYNANSEDITGLGAGAYQVVVTDANGCSTLGQFDLLAPAALFATATANVYPSGANTSCNGVNDGAIDASIGGGVPTYTLTWTGPNGYASTDEDLNNLMPGTYILNVTDLNGCTANAQATIQSPSELNVALSVSQYNSGDAVSCNGGSNGIIDLAINGGLPPYAVNWSGPGGFASNAIDIAGLQAGTYTAVVTDAAGCDTTFTVTLSEPGPVVANGIISDHNGFAISCNGSNTGSIDVTASGGAGNFTYQWTGPNAFVSTDQDIADLVAGAYVVSVSDMNGCTQQLNFNLTAPPALTSTASITGALCQGSNTGGIDLSIAGGLAPYAITWTGPGGYNAATEDIQSLFAGIYTATVTDLNGCSHVQPFAVDEPGVFDITASLSVYPGGYGVSCNGTTDGAIDITATGGTAPLFHTWQGPNGFVATTEDISDLAAGNYTLTLTDANGCSTLRSYTITTPTAIQIGPAASQFPDGSNVACSGGGNGSIDATIVGGVSPYTLAWSGPNGFISIAEDISDLPAGTYTLDVLDAIGCTGEASITLTEPDPIALGLQLSQFISGGNVSCHGTTDGSIELAVSGGSLLYFVHWTGPDGFASNDQDINGLAAGNYQVTVTDANGCTADAAATLIAPDPILVDIQVDQYGGGHSVPCNGSNGNVNTTVQGGAIPWTYLWTGPNGFTSTDADLQNVPAGTYDLLVTDAAGCTATASVTLTEPTPVAATASLTDDGFGHAVTCAGDNGAIDMVISGGVAPYIIDWSADNGFASLEEDIDSLSAGVYTVIVSDLNGCKFISSYTLSAPEPIQAVLTATPETCAGGGNGAIALTATGGSGPLSYAWTGANGVFASTQDPGALTSGTYTVTISDGGDCSGSWTTTVDALSNMHADIYRSTYGAVNIPCFGDSTGVIEVSIDGATAPLSVTWSGPNGFTSTALALSGLIAGDYTVTITDGNGCSLDSTITLTGPTTPMAASLIAAVFPGGVNVACHGGASGSIDATIIGGAGPYLFDWRGPDSAFYSTEDITGLVAGTYTLMVTDTNSCSASALITLTQPDSTVIDATIGTFTGGANTSCSGTADGSISVAISGGTPDHTLQWSGPDNFVSDQTVLSGLSAGDYLLTVTDLNGCQTTLPISLQGPAPINAQFLPGVQPGGTNISCAGQTDGSLQTLITGGVPGLSYLWNGPGGYTSTSADLTGLAAGQYCLTVTDTNGCSLQQCITLTAPDSLNASATSSPADCGLSVGSASATVAGGSAPFAYLWSNGQTTADMSGVATGTYAVTVTDANGCSAQATTVVAGSPAAQGTATVSNALCNGNADGVIDLTMTSGSAPYSYTWTGGISSEDIAGLAAGSYQVQVIDAAGCTWSALYTVDQPAAIGADSTVLVHANGFNISAMGAADGSITVDANGGTGPYSYLWSNGATTATIGGLTAGAYTVTITDANGCVQQLAFLLDQPNEVQLPTGFTPNGDGYNDVFVVRGIEGHRDNQLLVFNRWGNVVFDQLNYRNTWSGENLQGEPLPNGTYFVILRLGSDAANLQGYVDLRR